MNRHELGNRFAVFGDQNAIRIHAIEKRQTLFLEFGCGMIFMTRR